MLKQITLFSLAALSLTGGVAFAQGTTAPVTTPSRAEKVPTRTLKEVLKRIEEGAGAGIRIVADSSVFDEKVPLPTEPTTPANFEAQLATVLEALPKGTVWGKLYLPAAETRAYNGDDLADYALAQSKLFGKVGGATPGTVEVMGKILTADKAQTVVDALNLKPINLITNPTLKAASSGDSSAWVKMTDEEKAAFAKKEAQKMLNRGPEAFGKEFSNIMGQQVAVMGQMFGMMSPDQREQYRQSMMESMRSGMGANMMMMGNMQGGARGGKVVVTPAGP